MSDQTGDQRLWLNVLLSGVRVALKASEPDPWLVSPDFDAICWVAGLDPDGVRHTVKRGTLTMKPL